MTKVGSYAYLINKKDKTMEIFHGTTMNKAKEKGLRFIKERHEPFFRFTKVAFPHLFYVSESYLLYVTYARLHEGDIPYSSRLSKYDEEVRKEMKLFEEVTDKEFKYSPSSRVKRRRRSRRKNYRIKREKAGRNNWNKHWEG